MKMHITAILAAAAGLLKPGTRRFPTSLRKLTRQQRISRHGLRKGVYRVARKKAFLTWQALAEADRRRIAKFESGDDGEATCLMCLNTRKALEEAELPCSLCLPDARVADAREHFLMIARKGAPES